MWRVGLGTDSHRLIAGDFLWIGGVKISASFAAYAYSDGDVLLHALVDAIFGALALGDIGDFFPDTSEHLENQQRPSTDFLAFAVSKMREMNYRVQNLDAIINLERPKLSTHKRAIADNLAQWLGVAPTAVNVKAKTGEQRGAIGRGELISAQVVILLAANA